MPPFLLLISHSTKTAITRTCKHGSESVDSVSPLGLNDLTMEPMDIVGKSKEDASLPKATMTKIIKEMLPPDVRVARDAQDLLIECCVEFINLVSSESNEVCSREDKRTIAPEHVLKALQVLGFGEYIEDVYTAYEQHKLETMHDSLKGGGKWSTGAAMTEEEAAAAQQRMFDEARARMNEALSLSCCLDDRRQLKFQSQPLCSKSSTTYMARTSEDSSSKRHFHWTKKVGNEDVEAPSIKSSSNPNEEDKNENVKSHVAMPTPKKRLPAVAVARLRSVLAALGKNRSSLPMGLGSRVVGTLFGYRRGHVHFAFQRDPNSPPTFLIELATPISGLVREMASGLVRIALECDKEKEDQKKAVKLLEEPMWRTYCNGKRCGFATRKECGHKEWKVLKAVEPISMGAGVLPAAEAGADGELMYMRAKFERIVGSRDSEAFYMMNPDSNGAPELSIYLLRV
ncbi:hypothetical protein NC652_029446 [Populus alba x Populus x berolinensis]|nr:hypothetical protein NC652_029446 [Populus alba x Populus x berolinensis]